MHTKALLQIFVFTLAAAGFASIPSPQLIEGNAFDELASGALANSSSSTAQQKLEKSYKKLLDEIKSGLKKQGVSPQWHASILTKIRALEKQGLSAKKVAELRALANKLPVGGTTRTGFAPNATGNCTSNKKPVFTHAFTDLSKIAALNPIGGIGGGSPARSYIGVLENEEAPVYAPTDATLRAIIYADRGAGYGEYGLLMNVSCEIEILFDHIDRISERLQAYAPKTAATTTRGNAKQLSVPIKAGELLGYTNGTDLAHTFDFLVTNYGSKNNFLKPGRWQWEQAIYGTCPYDFFKPELRSLYYEKLGKPSSQGLLRASSCGNPSNDIAGTASGGWFKTGSTDLKGEYLAIARQFNDVQIAYRKDGQAFANPSNVQSGKPYFNLTDQSPEKYPADIKKGDTVCFEGSGLWAFVQLISDDELSVARGTGSCPAGFPAEQSESWYR